MTFTFDPATHRYEVDGLQIPSVSQLLHSAGLVDFGTIPQHILDYAARRGELVHRACQFFDEDDLHPDSLDPLIAPYVAAWRAFRIKHESRLKITGIEQIRLGELGGMRFGMTTDRIGLLDGQQTIIDIKTSRELQRYHDIQLAGYACGLAVGGGDAFRRVTEYRRIIVQLKSDATYRVRECDCSSDGTVFAAALCLHYWKQNGGAR